MSQNKSNKLQLALTGPAASPKLFSALQLACGLCGDWQKIVVVTSSLYDGRYQHLGDYSTLTIPPDASPSRYTELVNLLASCGKEVLIFSSLSREWRIVQENLDTSHYEDLLRAHRTFFHYLRHAPVHIIACLDSRTAYLQKDEAGKRRLATEQIIQEPAAERHFTTVLRLDKRGKANVLKDATGVFSPDQPFAPDVQHGALLYQWCQSGVPVIPVKLQQQIDGCSNMEELYGLLFETDIENQEILADFTKRRLELDEERKEPVLEVVPGGYL